MVDRLPGWAQVFLGVLVALAGVEGIATDRHVWAKLLFVLVLASGLSILATGVRRSR